MTRFALRLPEAAAACGMSESAFRQHYKSGHITAVFADSDPRFTPEELEAWVATWPTEKPTKK